MGQGPLSSQDSGDFILDLGLSFSLDLGCCPGLLFLQPEESIFLIINTQLVNSIN